MLPRFSRSGYGLAAVAPSCALQQEVEELPTNLAKIVKGFQAVPDPRARYQQLLYYASKLKPLSKEFQTPENKVTGCVSQVWVRPTMAEGGTVHFEADSDSQLTKGLAALLVEGLSGAQPEQILAVTPDFIQLLGLKQSLTPSRNNGFLNMLKLMQKKTLELYVKSQAVAGEGEGGRRGEEALTGIGGEESERSVNEVSVGAGLATAAALAASGPGNGSSASGGSGEGEGRAVPSVAEQSGSGVGKTGGGGGGGIDDSRPIYSSMRSKIEASLQPAVLEVDDVSYQHAGHAGVSQSSTSETHFNVKVVSDKFTGLTTVKRHRLVYDLLKEEFSQGLHALSLVTKTPDEILKG